MENSFLLKELVRVGKIVLGLLCLIAFLVLGRREILRIERNQHYGNIVPISITIPEGFNLNQIANVSALKLKNFNKDKFFLEARDQEGYLFPDTYFFLNNANEADVIKSMSENFNKKITSLLPEISSTGKSEKDIITMASIIEGESKGDVDRGVISGILWKRIKIGMPLQVDSAPETYKTKGLPENPISNPGLAAIIASIHPQNSQYLYYLHDKDGNIHYAKTFTEHNQNIKKYLK
ncbi:MAG: endolytic transglycosylase MltG [Candidatus Pacebacteria bacterium]|nr:endolytic transglycosylase MltG [Candidatus Paceibacterota bacterium]